MFSVPLAPSTKMEEVSELRLHVLLLAMREDPSPALSNTMTPLPPRFEVKVEELRVKEHGREAHWMAREEARAADPSFD